MKIKDHYYKLAEHMCYNFVYQFSKARGFMRTGDQQKVAIYVRVSTEDQAERGTIGQQLEFATKYADLHQLLIHDWYKDDGITGTLSLEDRPEGSRMLQGRAKWAV